MEPAAPPSERDGLKRRLAAVRAAIDAAAGGRQVRLVAASKHQSLATLRALYDLGQRDFGENYPQELARKAAAFAAEQLTVRWHLLGGLQANKAALIAPHASLVHSIDRPRTAAALARAVRRCGRPQPLDVLLQLAPEGPHRAGRLGVARDEAAALAREVRGLGELCLVGLMLLPSPAADARQSFARARATGDALRAAQLLPADYVLSMGMSGDFGAAVGEGATLVRIGTALFGPRVTATD